MADKDKGDAPVVERRVLVLAPVGRDAALVSGVLTHEGVPVHACEDVSGMCRELAQGAGALLLTEEALSPEGLGRLRHALQGEPPWSDIPLVVCTSSGDASQVSSGWYSMLEGRGHLTLLERPIHIRTLVTAVRSALRARRRQYEVRTLLRELADAATERERLLAREREARATAEAASQAKDVFLATLSHELRTPMNAIVGWSTMLAEGSLPREKERHAVAVIQRNACAQTQLIQDLLDVSAIVSGKMRLNVQRVDLASVVRHAVDTVRPTAELKGLRLESTVEKTAPTRADPDRLLQIVSNLLTNAVKFTPPGGEVRVTLACEAEQARLVVSDTGRGIPVQFLPFVFDRFRQADGSTTRKFGGLGLGLAIVRSLVELHGGTVEVSSPGEGQGATFSVTLPMRQQAADGEVQAVSESPVSSGALGRADELRGLRVLVVDDESDARELVAALLERCQAEVSQASNAAEALAAFEAQRPHIVVSDIAMPGEDGYALIRRLRERGAEGGGDVPAVALTAFARTEDASRALRAGFDVHLVKPVDPVELVTVLARLATGQVRRPGGTPSAGPRAA